MAYDQTIADLIATLTNPRYATAEPPATAPIIFDGFLMTPPTWGTGGGAVSTPVTFVAHPDDVHQYGVDVWNNAQSGIYGPIAPYAPFIPPPPPPFKGEEPVSFGSVLQDILARLERLEKNGSRHAKKATP